MNWEQYEKDKQYLVGLGYKPVCLTYQVGGYEDEDYSDIMVKDDIALIHGWYGANTWAKGKLSNCNFHDGFDGNSEIVNIYTL